MTETFSATDYTHIPTAQTVEGDNVPQAPETADAASNTLADQFKDVAREGSNKQLVLISDNPDGSANALLVRGAFGTPEAYWFVIDGGIMNARLASLVLAASNLSTDDLKTDEGVYKLMAGACGVAACFQTEIPGVSLREAFIGPLDHAMYEFVSRNRVSQAEIAYIKRSSNIAYKFRKYVQAQKNAAEAQASSGEYVSDDEMTDFFADLSADR